MADTETRVTAKRQTVFHVRHHGEWADISVGYGQANELRGGGSWMSINIMSSHGNYGYHGFSFDEPWWEFLLRMDKGYFIDKVMEQKDRREFSATKTIIAMKQSLLFDRKTGGCSKDEARAAWGTIEHLEMQDEDDYEFARVMGDDPYWHEEFYERFQHDFSSAANGLWENIWQPFIAQLRNRKDLQDAV